MNDTNRFLIFFLLIGLLYALYRYQDILFGENKQIKDNKRIENYENVKQIKYDNKKVSIDNISQLSRGSLDDEDGNNSQLYRQDSVIGSVNGNTNSLGIPSDDSGTIGSNDSFFF